MTLIQTRKILVSEQLFLVLLGLTYGMGWGADPARAVKKKGARSGENNQNPATGRARKLYKPITPTFGSGGSLSAKETVLRFLSPKYESYSLERATRRFFV
jgi:hypothetical protein